MSVTDALARSGVLMATLDLPTPVDVGRLCREVAARRGRELRLVPQDTTRDDLPSGLWAELPDHDEIHYDAVTSPVHRDLIVLHELGHILFDHYPAVSLAAAVGAAMPEVAGAAERMLCRGGYTAQEELEAETFATLVLDRHGIAPVRAVEPGGQALADQLRSTFGA